MPIRIAINGFGRIGRNVLRATWDNDDIEFVHINDLTSDDMLAYLLTNDSVHGRWKSAEAVDGGIRVDGVMIPTSAERDPKNLPWAERQVDIVLECTGAFTDGNKARAHIEAGAGKVVISAPGKNVDGTFVVGVNDDDITADATVVSNASCTTNCLAPLAKTLHECVGIEHGTMTTVHAYTMDQNLLDAPHSGGKFRRARAAAVNMVPTTTGAATAIGLVYPQLAGKLDGMAIRVPTPDGSLVDLCFTASRDTTVEEVNAAVTKAAEGPLKGILVIADKHTVSSDIVGNPASSIVDLSLTKVMGGRMVKMLTWYDNEWGFSNRMIDLARLLHNAS